MADLTWAVNLPPFIMSAEAEGCSKLANFIVFDANVSPEEGAVVDILYTYPKVETREERNMRDVEAGLCVTFVYFCDQFRPFAPCDYVFTGKREISLLPIGNNIYFSASVLSERSTRRLLLRSVLEMCRSILYLSVRDWKRRSDGSLPPAFRSAVQRLMPSILKVIRWDDLMFDKLWDAYMPAIVPQKILNRRVQRLREVKQKWSMVEAMILTNRSKVITYDCDPNLARLLVLLVTNKFPEFFPRKMRKRENRMRWSIGFYKDETGAMNIHTPPVLWEGKMYALTVLQLNKVRLLMLVNPTEMMNIDSFCAISRDVSEVMFEVDKLEGAVKPGKNPFGKVSVVKLKHSGYELAITNNNVKHYDYSTIEKAVLLCHEFSHALGPQSSSLFSIGKGFYAYFERNEGECYVAAQIKAKGLSDEIQTMAKIAKNDA